MHNDFVNGIFLVTFAPSKPFSECNGKVGDELQARPRDREDTTTLNCSNPSVLDAGEKSTANLALVAIEAKLSTEVAKLRLLGDSILEFVQGTKDAENNQILHINAGKRIESAEEYKGERRETL